MWKNVETTNNRPTAKLQQSGVKLLILCALFSLFQSCDPNETAEAQQANQLMKDHYTPLDSAFNANGFDQVFTEERNPDSLNLVLHNKPNRAKEMKALLSSEGLQIVENHFGKKIEELGIEEKILLSKLVFTINADEALFHPFAPAFLKNRKEKKVAENLITEALQQEKTLQKIEGKGEEVQEQVKTKIFVILMKRVKAIDSLYHTIQRDMPNGDIITHLEYSNEVIELAEELFGKDYGNLTSEEQEIVKTVVKSEELKRKREQDQQ